MKCVDDRPQLDASLARHRGHAPFRVDLSYILTHTISEKNSKSIKFILDFSGRVW